MGEGRPQGDRTTARRQDDRKGRPYYTTKAWEAESHFAVMVWTTARRQGDRKGRPYYTTKAWEAESHFAVIVRR